MPRFLAFFVRPARDGQAPRYQRRNVFRPAMLNRKFIQINVFTFPHNFLTRRIFHYVRCHAPNIFQQWQFGKRIFDAFGRFGFFQIRQRLPDFAQLGHTVRTHAQRHAFGRAEQIRQHRIIITRAVGLNRILKQQRRPFGTQHAVGDFGHFQMRGNGVRDAFEFALLLEHGDEVAQVFVFHVYPFCPFILSNPIRIPPLSLPALRHILCRDKSRVPADVRRFDEVAAKGVDHRVG